MIDLIIKLITASLPFLKSKLSLYLLGISLIIGASFYGGYWVCDAKASKEKLDAVKRAISESKEQLEIDREILEDSIEIQTVIIEKFKTIEDDIKDVEINNCDDLGDDWRRLYNNAAKAASTATAN